MYTDEIISFGPGNSNSGILTLPESMQLDTICCIFLNAGIIHRVGPNEVFVKISRILVKKGIASLRFDICGVGDSTPNNIESRTVIEEIDEAIQIVRKQYNLNKIILIGMCSSTLSAYQYAIKKDGVRGLIIIEGVIENEENLKRLIYLAHYNTTVRYYRKNLFQFNKYKRIFTGKTLIMKFLYRLVLNVFKKIIWRKEKEGMQKEQLDRKLFNQEEILKLSKRKTNILFCFAEGSHIYNIYKRSILNILKSVNNEFENISFKYFKGADHVFTPIFAQQELSECIQKWLEGINNEDIVT